MDDSTLDLDHCRDADAAEAAAYVDLYAAAPAELVAATGLRAESVAGATLLLAPGLPTPIFNRAIGFGSFEPGREAALDAILSRYAAANVRNFWLSVSPAARPSTIPDWLAARGFVPARRPLWAQMRWPDRPAPEVASSLDIGDVTAREATDLAAVVATAFEMPPPVVQWLAALVGRAGWRTFAARSGGRIVGGGFVYTAPPLAWLGMGSILPTHRGDNGQLALFAARIAHARALGCSAIHTETGEAVAGEPNPSLANMARCGFVRVASRPNFAKSLQ